MYALEPPETWLVASAVFASPEPWRTQPSSEETAGSLVWAAVKGFKLGYHTGYIHIERYTYRVYRGTQCLGLWNCN